MLTYIKEEKAALKEQERLKEKWENQLSEYRIERQKKQEEKESIEDEIRACKNKYYKLKSKGLTALLARLRGDLHDALQHHEDQLIEWEKAYEKVNGELIDLLDKMSALRKKIKALPNAKKERARILKEQRLTIEKLGTHLSKSYVRIDNEIHHIEAFLQAKKAAIQIGKDAEEEFEQAKKLLKKAEKWGVFDAFSKKGYAAHKKHQYISDANDCALLAQSKRKILEGRISDMSYESDIHFQIDESFVFADFVLDGIYINLLVQERIEDSLREIDGQMNSVHRMLNQIRFRSDKKRKEMEELIEERNHLLTKIEKHSFF